MREEDSYGRSNGRRRHSTIDVAAWLAAGAMSCGCASSYARYAESQTKTAIAATMLCSKVDEGGFVSDRLDIDNALKLRLRTQLGDLGSSHLAWKDDELLHFEEKHGLGKHRALPQSEDSKKDAARRSEKPENAKNTAHADLQPAKEETASPPAAERKDPSQELIEFDRALNELVVAVASADQQAQLLFDNFATPISSKPAIPPTTVRKVCGGRGCVLVSSEVPLPEALAYTADAYENRKVALEKTLQTLTNKNEWATLVRNLEVAEEKSKSFEKTFAALHSSRQIAPDDVLLARLVGRARNHVRWLNRARAIASALQENPATGLQVLAARESGAAPRFVLRALRGVVLDLDRRLQGIDHQLYGTWSIATLLAPELQQLPDDVLREVGRQSALVLTSAGISAEGVIAASCAHLKAEEDATLVLRLNALYVGMVEGAAKTQTAQDSLWAAALRADWSLNLAQQQSHGLELTPPEELPIDLQDAYFDEVAALPPTVVKSVPSDVVVPPTPASPPPGDPGPASDVRENNRILARLLARMQTASAQQTLLLRLELQRLIDAEAKAAGSQDLLLQALGNTTTQVNSLLAQANANAVASQEAEITQTLCSRLLQHAKNRNLVGSLACDAKDSGGRIPAIDFAADKTFATGEWRLTSEGDRIITLLNQGLNGMRAELKARKTTTKFRLEITGSASAPKLSCECLAARMALASGLNCPKEEEARPGLPVDIDGAVWSTDNKTLTLTYEGVTKRCQGTDNVNAIIADYRALTVRKALLRPGDSQIEPVFVPVADGGSGDARYQRVEILMFPTRQ